MSQQIYNVENDPRIQAFGSLVHQINNAIGKIHGDRAKFDLTPKQGTFLHKKRNSKGEIVGEYTIRYNSYVPNEELFSLAQDLIRPADEPFSARNIFSTDSSFHPGSQTIGFDVISEEGKAELVATGQTMQDIPEADATVSRNLQPVGKLAAFIKVTRDDMQQMALRNDRGLGPLIDLMQEKLRIARKNIARQEDFVVWAGGRVKGAATNILGVFDFISTDSNLNSGNAPTKGRLETVATRDGDVVWADKTADEIIADIAVATAYVNRNGTYFPNTLALPFSILTQELGLKRTSDTDSTPLIEWIKRAFQNMYGRELKIVGTNALEDGSISGTTQGNPNLSNKAFMLLDSNKMYQSINVVEDVTLLPAKEDEQGTIKQVVQMKTGGYMTKHPSTIYVGRGIAA